MAKETTSSSEEYNYNFVTDSMFASGHFMYGFLKRSYGLVLPGRVLNSSKRILNERLDEDIEFSEGDKLQHYGGFLANLVTPLIGLAGAYSIGGFKAAGLLAAIQLIDVAIELKNDGGLDSKL